MSLPAPPRPRTPRPPLGAHVSVAGRLPRCFERAARIGCGAAQIFVKSPNQWRGRDVPESEVAEFRSAHGASEVGPLLAHAAYLINLAATDEGVLERSVAGLGDELDRAERLGVEGLVVHPGAHLGEGEERGVERAARALDRVFAARPQGQGGQSIRLLLENTAGQGTCLGHRLEHLAAIRAASEHPERIGFCLDTCHAFAAGYPLHEAREHDAWLQEVDAVLGLEDVRAWHLNDSRHPLGSRKDRHANLGAGEIGADAFGRLVTDPRLAGMPMVLETPSGDDLEGHREDLALLSSFLSQEREERARARGARGESAGGLAVVP